MVYVLYPFYLKKSIICRFFLSRHYIYKCYAYYQSLLTVRVYFEFLK